MLIDRRFQRVQVKLGATSREGGLEMNAAPAIPEVEPPGVVTLTISQRYLQ
jgi:hypothetical protein